MKITLQGLQINKASDGQTISIFLSFATQSGRIFDIRKTINTKKGLYRVHFSDTIHEDFISLQDAAKRYKKLQPYISHIESIILSVNKIAIIGNLVEDK